MQRLATADLPRVVRQHIEAYNRHDPDAFMATLAPDALVNDIRREFLGAAAIRAWADKEIFGDNVTLDITDAFEHFGNIVARFSVDGDFDKSKLPMPLILTYYFSIQGDRITQIIILHNAAVAP